MYPGFDLNGRLLINHSDAITGAVCEPPTKYGMGWRQKADADPAGARAQLRRQWEPLLATPQGEKLILSGENVAEYSDVDMQRLKAELEPHCERLRVLALIRSPQSSLESILQQRVKGGLAVTRESILGVVKRRYQSLKRNFPGQLDVANFHEAVQHPRGLVGFFMEYCGLPAAAIPDDDFSSNNERISLEAFDIMYAINQRYPRPRVGEHGVQRALHDLRPLRALPGQPFQIEGFARSRLGRLVRKEGRWLERELGFRFPDMQPRPLARQWQDETLEALEETINSLREPIMRQAALDHLDEVVRELRWRDLPAAATLAYMIPRMRTSLTREGREMRREELLAEPFDLAATRAQALPWYKEKLLRDYPILKLPLALKRLLVRTNRR